MHFTHYKCYVSLHLQGDYESESRKKLDGLYQEVKKKLEDEQNKRTRDHNSAIAVNEKLYALEKQVSIFRYIAVMFTGILFIRCEAIHFMKFYICQELISHY